SCAEVRLDLAQRTDGIHGVQRLDVAVPARDDGLRARHPAEEEPDDLRVETRHVARGDEDVRVPAGEQRRVDARERTASRKLVGDRLDVEAREVLRTV